MEELEVGHFRGKVNTLKAAFSTTTALERQQVLIREVSSELVQIGFDGNRGGKREIKRFRASFIGKLSEIRLCSEQEKISARAMADVGIIDGPNVDILLLRVFDGRFEIGAGGKISVEVVDSGGNDEYGATFPGGRPTLDQVLQREIRAGKRTGANW